MKLHATYNRGLGLGILKAVRLWSNWNPKRVALLWNRLQIFRKANDRRADLHKKHGLLVPPVLVLSVTMRCNLNCTGCYSRQYPRDRTLSLEEIDGIMTEAEELGISFFVITGGEPLLVDGLTKILARHPRLIFFLFTNGTLVEETWAEEISRLGNIIPILSVEGDDSDTDSRRGQGVYESVLHGMECLKDAGGFFGFSSMVTAQNVFHLGGKGFLDRMIKLGCRMGYFGNYVPCWENAPRDLQLPWKEQLWFRRRVREFQKRKRIILIHMPDDEYDIGGSCMAAGRGFLHVNSQGFAEPCPFAHIAASSIREESLRQILGSPLFTFLQSRVVSLGHPEQGCALFENRAALWEEAKAMGALSTETAGSPAP